MNTRKRRALSKPQQVAIFRRDGWLCCWCKKPVIFAPVMRLLEIEAKHVCNGPLAYYHAHWTRNGSPLLDELGAVIDHVEAFSTGGPDDEDNMRTACNKCNGRKSAAPLDRWDQRNKSKPIKGKYGEPQHWDGLSLIFVLLATQNRDQTTAGEKEWLRALRQSDNGPDRRAPVSNPGLRHFDSHTR